MGYPHPLRHKRIHLLYVATILGRASGQLLLSGYSREIIHRLFFSPFGSAARGILLSGEADLPPFHY
jgi:hypothetical protein